MSLLASDERYQKAQTAFDNAKKMYADCFLSDAISQIRADAGTAINFLLDAVMLYHGRYFRNGVKRTFDELKVLPLSFNMEDNIMDIIRAETNTEIRNGLTTLMRNVQALLLFHSSLLTSQKSNKLIYILFRCVKRSHQADFVIRLIPEIKEIRFQHPVDSRTGHGQK